jgi:hypothetical protein
VTVSFSRTVLHGISTFLLSAATGTYTHIRNVVCLQTSCDPVFPESYPVRRRRLWFVLFLQELYCVFSLCRMSVDVTVGVSGFCLLLPAFLPVFCSSKRVYPVPLSSVFDGFKRQQCSFLQKTKSLFTPSECRPHT